MFFPDSFAISQGREVDTWIKIHLNFRFRACFKQGGLHIQETIECGFTLKRVPDMIRTYSQIHSTDKYSQYSSIIWPVWLNSWAFVYNLSGCGFESRCSHLNFRFRASFEKGVPWHSGNYIVWIHSETCTWHEKNIQLPYLLFISWNIYFFTRYVIYCKIISILCFVFEVEHNHDV